MLRGMTTFKCTEFKRTFRAPDFEYMATVYSMPQRCKHCDSIRTLPLSSYSGVFSIFGFGGILKIFGFGKPDRFYEELWEKMESK